jgi:hypothetical protein
MTRFSIAGSMVAILYVGIGIAALRSPKPWIWESAVMTITTTLLAASTTTAFADIGRRKMEWVGFSIFGWSYIITTYMVSPNWVGSVPLMTYVLRELANESKELMGVPFLRLDTYLVVGHSMFAVLFGLVGASLGRALARRDTAVPEQGAGNRHATSIRARAN